jgi:hypothetical protein
VETWEHSSPPKTGMCCHDGACNCFAISLVFAVRQLLSNTARLVRFEVLMVASMKMAVYWVVVPCSLVEV